MKHKFKIFIVSIALLLSSLACAALMGEEEISAPPSASQPEAIPAAPLETEPPTAEIPPTPAPVACPVITDQIMELSYAESEGEGEYLDEEVYLVTYYVSGDEFYDVYYEDVSEDLLAAQNDEETHQQIWDFFAALIPAEWRENIGEYSIITDGADGTLAAVAQTMDDPNLWGLEVDIADTEDYYSLTFTLIHEFGHLLTLGPDQVPPSLAIFNNPDDDNIYLAEASKCPRYFPGEGCANADSYINAYYDQFWADIYEEWNEINLEENEDIYYEKLDEFYYTYEDQFVSDYAATNPEEDIAETWSFFVVNPKPAGETIAEEKILFFYQYPELVELREEILSNVCTLLEE